MASMLALMPHSPLKRSFSDTPYFPSCSPMKGTSLAPLQDITSRNVSACSLYTLGSNRAGDWLQGSENAPPSLTSLSLLDLVPDRGRQESSLQVSDHGPRKRSCGVNRPLPSFSYVSGPSTFPSSDGKKTSATNIGDTSDDSSDAMELDQGNVEDSELFNLYDAIQIPLPEEPHILDDAGTGPIKAPVELPVPLAASSQPFRRWISTLRRRHVQRRRENVIEDSRLSFDIAEGDTSHVAPLPSLSEATCKTTESVSSSLIYVTAMKPASVTIASASIALRSDGIQGNHRLGNRSSNYSDARRSMDSHGGALGPVIDESAWLRSLQRRKVVEELIASEESYIADLKVLINDYFMILSAIPTLPHPIRSSIQQNISQILQLHEDLLSELHQTIPHADFTQSAQHETYPVTKAKHIRFHSADMIPGRFAEHKAKRRLRHSLDIGRSPERRPAGLASDTKTIGQIAKIFNKHMKRFFAYEEYGAHWTTMSQDLTTACKGLHGWQEYERGIEALSKVVSSENNRETSSRKALSFADLLIKPIQRVCKYPLLFDDLCRHTPVYDDPEAHAELEKALFRLQVTIREVNKAKDDPKTRRLIEITWQLQDRLAFQEQAISRALVFRLLGHVLVCGTLHVTYQSSDRIKGQYMVCVLYKSCLVLATTGRFYTSYNVVASIPLANASIDEPDNGRGLQCHTAPHTWKLVFEYGHRLHEIILSACSSQEEDVWKAQLRQRIVCETHDFVEGQSTMQDMFSSLSLDIKSIGPVFGHANSLVRRISVHRAATLGSKTNMAQVIIKNTQAQKLPEPPLPAGSPALVSRSQSHMSVNHVPTLAPRRAERTRLETALEDVWTKDILPFPGMSNRRVETQIRASANSVMRKLSMASIASNFSRRSPSFSSISNARSEDSFGSRVHKISQGNMRAHPAADRRPAPAVVDFHNAPAAFLPTDFELQDTRPASRRRRLANRAAGAENSSEKGKGIPGKQKRARRLSTHIISLPRTDPNRGVEVTFPLHGIDISVLRPAEANLPIGKRGGNEKQKAKEEREENIRAASSSSQPPTRKFLKSKSKIFKFWV